jgi:hypothetical protein
LFVRVVVQKNFYLMYERSLLPIIRVKRFTQVQTARDIKLAGTKGKKGTTTTEKEIPRKATG